MNLTVSSPASSIQILIANFAPHVGSGRLALIALRTGCTGRSDDDASKFFAFSHSNLDYLLLSSQHAMRIEVIWPAERLLLGRPATRFP